MDIFKCIFLRKIWKQPKRIFRLFSYVFPGRFSIKKRKKKDDDVPDGVISGGTAWVATSRRRSGAHRASTRKGGVASSDTPAPRTADAGARRGAVADSPGPGCFGPGGAAGPPRAHLAAAGNPRGRRGWPGCAAPGSGGSAGPGGKKGTLGDGGNEKGDWGPKPY